MAAAHLEQLATRATELHLGERALLPMDAVLTAHRTLRDREFKHIGDETVPFTALDALDRRRTIVVRLNEAEYRFAETGDAGDVVHVDDGHLLFVLAGPKKVDIPLHGKYEVRVDSDGAPMAGSYDLVEARESIRAPTDTAQPFVVRLPVTGLSAEREAHRHALPVITLELQLLSMPVKATASAAKTGARLYNVLVRVKLRPSTKRRHHGTHAYSRSSRRFFNGPELELAYRMPSETVLTTEAYASIAKRLFETAGLSPADYTFSCYVTCKERPLVAHESNGSGVPDVYALGDLTQAFAAIAVVDEVLRVNARVAEVNLHSRRVLYDMLTASGATNVRDALLEVYSRGGERELPSVAHLLLHTSGLPAYAGMGMHDLQWMLADKGGLAPPETLEERFAALLRNKVALMAPPGATYEVSALGWAVLMFAMAGQEKSSAVVDALHALGASDRTRFATSPGDSTYQGVYRMYSGLSMDAASIARVCSHRTWFASLARDDQPSGMSAPAVVITKRFDWVSQLLTPRCTIRDGEMACGYGGWMSVEDAASGHHVVYAAGRHHADLTLVAFVPALGLSAVLAVRCRRPGAAPYPSARKLLSCLVPSMLSMLCKPGVELVPRLGAFPRLRFPKPSRAAALYAQRSADVIAGNGTLADDSPEVARYFKGRFVSLFDRDSTLEIAPRMTHPGPAMRYVATVTRGPWSAEYEVVNDRERLADPENPDAPRCGLRLVDPYTHNLSSPVYLSLLRSESEKQHYVPVVMLHGAAYTRDQFAASVRAHFDENSPEARARFARAKLAAEESAAHAAEVRARRDERRRVRARQDDESSGDDSDDEITAAPLLDADPMFMEIINGDIFSAIASDAPSKRTAGGRAQWGNWSAWIGSHYMLPKASTHAYPSGTRLYPLADHIPRDEPAVYYL